MSKERISILCADVSRNAFGRVYVLARILQRSFNVKVVGPQFGSSVWAPMAGLLETEGVEVCAIPTARYPRFVGTIGKLWRAIDGDLLYASKPYPTSYGLALAYGRARRIPVVLDIDDWELANYPAGGWQRWITFLQNLPSPNNPFWMQWLYRRVHRADALTVSSRFLQRLYGGTIVPHGRDTTAMNPEKVDREEIRRRFGLDGRIVMFFGTPRPHKGIEDLIAAVARLHRPEVTCVVVGANTNETYDASLASQTEAKVRLLPMQPFDRVPAFMAAADVVVVPQRQTPFSEAQMPAKLYDAMAMARPIVATQISDIPEVLAGCGLVVPPNDVAALSAAIAHLLDNPQEAEQLGKAARDKCIRCYSWDAMQATLETLIQNVFSIHRG